VRALERSGEGGGGGRGRANTRALGGEVKCSVYAHLGLGGRLGLRDRVAVLLHDTGLALREPLMDKVGVDEGDKLDVTPGLALGDVLGVAVRDVVGDSLRVEVRDVEGDSLHVAVRVTLIVTLGLGERVGDGDLEVSNKEAPEGHAMHTGASRLLRRAPLGSPR
jgi:hypothetical protein